MKTKRILILGGAGYIGSSLIEQYKKKLEYAQDFVKNGNKWSLQEIEKFHVYIVDKKDPPVFIQDLPKDTFTYLQHDISDLKYMKNVFDSILPHTIIMLSAAVEAESSGGDREKEVLQQNFINIKNMIDMCNNKQKIIFASSCNVFGGYTPDDDFMNLTELSKPKPKLPYALSKHGVEEYLRSTDKNYVICRFGTNFGYAPGIRFNLVTNIFFLKMLRSETIQVYGDGMNYRPFLHVKDTARGIIFLDEKNANGTYHLTYDSFRIKDVAEKISIFNPNCNVELLPDRTIPFLGYHVSGKKIQDLGFEYKWSIESGMEDMIPHFQCIKEVAE